MNKNRSYNHPLYSIDKPMSKNKGKILSMTLTKNGAMSDGLTTPTLENMTIIVLATMSKLGINP